MKPRYSNQTNLALTLVEVMVVLVVLAVLACMFLPVLEHFNKNCSQFPKGLVNFGHANDFTGSAGTNPGRLRQQ